MNQPPNGQSPESSQPDSGQSSEFPAAAQPDQGTPSGAPQATSQPAQPAPQYAPPPHQYGAPYSPQPPHPNAGAQYYPPPQFPAAPANVLPGPGGPFDGAQDPQDLSRPLYRATMSDAVKRFFKQYADFSGRASRSEYWWVALFLFMIEFIPMLFVYGSIFTLLALNETTNNSLFYSSQFPAFAFAAIWMLVIGGVLLLLINLALLVPSLALLWRRLHDANLAGPLVFLSLVPYAGTIAMFVFLLLPPKAEARRFDPPRA